jgi:hypothetical protein
MLTFSPSTQQVLHVTHSNRKAKRAFNDFALRVKRCIAMNTAWLTIPRLIPRLRGEAEIVRPTIQTNCCGMKDRSPFLSIPLLIFHPWLVYWHWSLGPQKCEAEWWSWLAGLYEVAGSTTVLWRDRLSHARNTKSVSLLRSLAILLILLREACPAVA